MYIRKLQGSRQRSTFPNYGGTVVLSPAQLRRPDLLAPTLKSSSLATGADVSRSLLASPQRKETHFEHSSACPTAYTSTRNIACEDHRNGSPRTTDIRTAKTLVCGKNMRAACSVAADTASALQTNLSFSSLGCQVADQNSSSPLQKELGCKVKMDTSVAKGRLRAQSCMDNNSARSELPATAYISPCRFIGNADSRISKGGWTSEMMLSSPKTSHDIRKEGVPVSSMTIEFAGYFPARSGGLISNRNTARDNVMMSTRFYPRNGTPSGENRPVDPMFVKGKSLTKAAAKGIPTHTPQRFLAVDDRMFQLKLPENCVISAPPRLCQTRSCLSPVQLFSVDRLHGDSDFSRSEHSGRKGDNCVDRSRGLREVSLRCAPPVAAKEHGDTVLRRTKMGVNVLSAKQQPPRPTTQQSGVICRKSYGNKPSTPKRPRQRKEPANYCNANAGGGSDDDNDEDSEDKEEEDDEEEDDDDDDDDEEEEEEEEDESDEDDDDDDDDVYEGFENVLAAGSRFARLAPNYRSPKLSPLNLPSTMSNKQSGDGQVSEAHCSYRKISGLAGGTSPPSGRLAPNDEETSESPDGWMQAVTPSAGTDSCCCQDVEDSASATKTFQPLSLEMMREYFKRLKRTYCCSEEEREFIDALMLRNSEGQHVYDRFSHAKFDLVRQGSQKSQGIAIRQSRDDSHSNQSSVKDNGGSI